MKINTEFDVGQYVKCSEGKIHEVTEIDVNVSFDSDLMTEVVSTLYEVVDLADWRVTAVEFEFELDLATPAEIDAYLDENEDNIKKVNDLEMVGEPLDEVIAKILREQISTNDIKVSVSTPEYEAEYDLLSSTRNPTVDNLLDDYITLQTMIQITGDEDGKYKNLMGQVLEKLDEVSRSGK